MRRWTEVPAGASLSTTLPRTLKSPYSGSFSAPLAPSSRSRWSAICSRTNARVLALSLWPTTTRPSLPYRVSTDIHSATESSRCHSRRASARLARTDKIATTLWIYSSRSQSQLDLPHHSSICHRLNEKNHNIRIAKTKNSINTNSAFHTLLAHPKERHFLSIRFNWHSLRHKF